MKEAYREPLANGRAERMFLIHPSQDCSLTPATAGSAETHL